MTLSPAQLQTPSPVCVHFAAAAPKPEPPVHLAELDGAAIHDHDELMDAFAVALSFPDYFGRNWDALDECLRDLSWIGAPGYAVVIRGAGHLWQAHPRLAGNLVESWLLCAASWSDRDTAFHLVFEW